MFHDSRDLICFVHFCNSVQNCVSYIIDAFELLEKTLERPLDCKEIQPLYPEGDQPWDFLGRNDAKAETVVLWPPHVKSWLIGKDCDAGRDWGQEEKGTTEDEMAGWHHWLDGHESEWTPGVGDGQGGLACYNSWGRKDSDTTERLNWTEHECICVPHSETPSNLPPHPIPQGCLSALALSALFHASNLDWWSISYMVIYMF